MLDVVIQRVADEDADFVGHLRTLGFTTHVLGLASPRFMSKPALVIQSLRAAVRIVRWMRPLGTVGTVVVLGHLFHLVKILSRLHLIHYNRLLCSNFFVRGPKWFPVFRGLCSIDTKKEHYLIFSRSEIDVYAERLGIDRLRMHYLPPGDWHPLEQPVAGEPSDYYFAGGYSNRDYRSAIEAFRNLNAKLLIVCSELTRELDHISLPPNVTVLRDISSDCFENYVRRAKAGIVPSKYDTGSAGQTVILRLMRNAKVAIANDFGAVRDFIEPGKTGYLLQDMRRDLPGLIAMLEGSPERVRAMGRAARCKYEQSFSRPSLVQQFGDILQQVKGKEEYANVAEW